MTFRWRLPVRDNMRYIATLFLVSVALRSEMHGKSISHVKAACPSLPPFTRTLMTTTALLSAIMNTIDVHGKTLQISEYQKLRQNKDGNSRTRIRRRRTTNYSDETRSSMNRALGAGNLKLTGYASSSRKKQHSHSNNKKHHSKNKKHNNGKKKGKSSKLARYPGGLAGHPYYKHLVPSSSSSKKHTPRKGDKKDNSVYEDYAYSYWYGSMSLDFRAPVPSPIKRSTRAPTPPTSTLAPCDDPEMRTDIITDRLREISGDSIDDQESPQGEAADWIINVDDINQCAPNLDQRYALAVFYFATNGDDWENKMDWLSPALECNWFSIACGNTDRVTEIGSNRTLCECHRLFEPMLY
jgi:hypothetical protein